MDKNLDRMLELTGILRVTNKRLAGLDHEAWQPRLATVVDDVEPDTKSNHSPQAYVYLTEPPCLHTTARYDPIELLINSSSEVYMHVCMYV